jgi:hypothetical protein
MIPDLYSDGVGEITVSGSIVRVDLVILSPTERDEKNNAKSVLRQRLIFSVEGFANSVDVMQNALQSLVDAGVVRRNQPRALAEPPHIASAAERGPAAPSNPPRSPNVSSNFR